MTIGSGLAVAAIWGATAVIGYVNPGGNGYIVMVSVMAMFSTVCIVVHLK